MSHYERNREYAPMVLRWRWATLLFLMMAAWVGCSGSSAKDPPSKPAAGKGGGSAKGGGAGLGTGGTDGGNAGDDGQGGSLGGGSGQGARAGAGGSAAVGGAAGGAVVGGTGGVAGFGGNAASAGSGLVGGSGGTGGIPFTWDCATEAYGDGDCHCGCGAPDPDCDSGELDDCEVCDAPGSCNGAECPGRIDEANTAKCSPPAVGWICEARRYGDGENCECGCGAVDVDCADETVESCDVCDAFNACSTLECPSKVAPDDNAHCYNPPGWTCYFSVYGDGYCDCGCGVVDVDCEDATEASCDFCPQASCTPFDCTDTLLPDNNAVCLAPPGSWTCPARLYNSGGQCDCGCGFMDPDCESAELAACDKCNGEGSCSGQACPGMINEDDITSCVRPPVPDGWTCYDYYYGDGYACHCGCGVQDADCRSTSIDQCEACTCGGVGGCPGLVDPDDTTECLPAPDGWTCNDNRYGDGVCDCGCGIDDPDCYPEYPYCSRCPEESCAHGDCSRIDLEDVTQCLYDIPAGWTCGNYFFDGVCDCGCGADDVDCLGTNILDCDACDTPGSCSDTSCPGTISPSDITSCTP
jgi:hypothetical protein